jgi:hypothetical protein
MLGFGLHKDSAMYRYAFVLLALSVAGCETDPPAPSRPASVPLAAPGQHVAANGEIRSVHAPYAVMVTKMNHGDRSMSDLAEHGLPVMVIFANLSAEPVSFGPDNISTGDGGIPLLSARDIQKIKEDEQSSNNTSSFFDALFAIAGAAQASQLAQTGAVTQMQASALAQGYATLAVTDIADNNAQNQKIEQDEATLVDHYRAVVLEQTTVGPHQQIGGMVFLRHAMPSSQLALAVSTGDYIHHFSFVSPDALQHIQDAVAPQPPLAPPPTASTDINPRK